MGAPDQKNGDECCEANKIEDGSLVENQMIVQARKHEHQDEADDQPAHLLHVHALEGAAVRGGIDFHYAEGADGGEDGQKQPVVIASSGCVTHGRGRKWKMENGNSKIENRNSKLEI